MQVRRVADEENHVIAVYLTQDDANDLTEYLITASFVEAVTKPMPGHEVASKILNTLRAVYAS